VPASSRIPLAHGQITPATTQSSSNWSSPPTCRPSSESSGLARQRSPHPPSSAKLAAEAMKILAYASTRYAQIRAQRRC
jgi:hypothetical protein